MLHYQQKLFGRSSSLSQLQGTQERPGMTAWGFNVWRSLIWNVIKIVIRLEAMPRHLVLLLCKCSPQLWLLKTCWVFSCDILLCPSSSIVENFRDLENLRRIVSRSRKFSRHSRNQRSHCLIPSSSSPNEKYPTMLYYYVLLLYSRLVSPISTYYHFMWEFEN